MASLGYDPAPRELFGRAQLARLIDPSSVAVVGASETPGSFGLRTLENIKAAFKGRVFPVNPRYEQALQWRCYASLDDLPEPPDCVILAVPRERVEQQIARAAAIGAGGVILYTSGYAEVGIEERIAAQRRLAEIARDTGLRIIGPNCAGIANLVSGAGLTFMPKFHEMPRIQGGIGLISQSGALGYVMLQALERGIGFSHYLSAGNSCDVNVCDFINYLVEDPSARVIVCMLEGVRDGARLLRAARRALEAGKPLLVYKLGNSAISRATAMSHTGTLVGAATAYRAAFQRNGVVMIDKWEEVLETANFFAKAGRPGAAGVGVMASSGGAAVMAADEAEEVGVALPPPAPETSRKLEAVIPEFGSSANPSDITAESIKSVEMYGECIRAFADDPGFGAVVVPMMSSHRPVAPERAAYLAKLAPTLARPMCLVWLNEWLQGPGSEIYDGASHISTFRSMARCMRAIKRWQDYYGQRDTLLLAASPIDVPGAAASARAAVTAADPGRSLSERASKSILATYGIPIARELTAASAEEAVAASGTLGYPVALKADSPDIAHKTEAGAVKLALGDPDAVRRAYAEIVAAVKRQPGARMHGVLVQEMAVGGAEMMIGARVDAQFGPLVTCGFGGIAVELTRDVVTALAPVDTRQALEMIRSLKGYRLLTGFRRLPALDVDAFADVVCRLSRLAADLAPEIEEINVNPVVLRTRGAIAVDALVVRTAKATGISR